MDGDVVSITSVAEVDEGSSTEDIQKKKGKKKKGKRSDKTEKKKFFFCTQISIFINASLLWKTKQQGKKGGD